MQSICKNPINSLLPLTVPLKLACTHVDNLDLHSKTTLWPALCERASPLGIPRRYSFLMTPELLMTFIPSSSFLPVFAYIFMCPIAGKSRPNCADAASRLKVERNNTLPHIHVQKVRPEAIIVNRGKKLCD